MRRQNDGCWYVLEQLNGFVADLEVARGIKVRSMLGCEGAGNATMSRGTEEMLRQKNEELATAFAFTMRFAVSASGGPALELELF